MAFSREVKYFFSHFNILMNRGDEFISAFNDSRDIDFLKEAYRNYNEAHLAIQKQGSILGQTQEEKEAIHQAQQEVILKISQLQVETILRLCEKEKNKLFTKAAILRPDLIDGTPDKKSTLKAILDGEINNGSVIELAPQLTEIYDKCRVLNKFIKSLSSQNTANVDKLANFKQEFENENNLITLNKRRGYNDNNWQRFWGALIDLISSTFSIWKTDGSQLIENINNLKPVNIQKTQISDNEAKPTPKKNITNVYKEELKKEGIGWEANTSNPEGLEDEGYFSDEANSEGPSLS